MQTLKNTHLIQKRNVLNELRSNNMTLQELRFFSVYLSKIDKNDMGTRIVRFRINDFKAILELSSRTNLHIVNVTNSLLSKVVNVPNERGGYEGFQLFKECRVDVDENAEWYVEIDAHDKALPLMFEFKNKYFTYQLWNALRLKSSNQLRMYEILKQYQAVGYRILKVEDLKDLLGIRKNEYSRFNNLKKWVIDACQQALAEHTDIKFTYELHGKKGPGGRVLALKFIIEKNENYKDKLSLDMFINQQEIIESLNLNEIDPEEADGLVEDGVISKSDALMIFLRGAFDNRFSVEEVQTLYNLIAHNLPREVYDGEVNCYNHMKYWYDYVKAEESKGNVQKSFLGYLKKVIINPVSNV